MGKKYGHYGYCLNPFFFLFLNSDLYFSATAIREEKEIKGIQIATFLRGTTSFSTHRHVGGVGPI